MIQTTPFFNVLDTVDSTNNYAMAKVHAGMALHGQTWYAKTQTMGKGQRGKIWFSTTNENIMMSLILQPKILHTHQQFYLSMLVAIELQRFFCKYAGEEVCIKWPNDLYWRDRKAGGILIQNLLQGQVWKWAVIGIGVNVNQTIFDKTLNNPISLHQITQFKYDVIDLAKELSQNIFTAFDKMSLQNVLHDFNQLLFKKNEPVKLKYNNEIIDTIIKAVNEKGQLITEDVIKRTFDFGQVEWLL
jgi:BirA family transcriptional regulator, biotin operon repressor / biotin---[acetyl-CoA-carboxylase] ligase